jgi:nicotinamidase/pyrazinamidase
MFPPLWWERLPYGRPSLPTTSRLDVGSDIVRKGTGGEDGYSGFTVRDPQGGEREGTELEPLLRGRGVRRLVILGLATDYCVKETALDAVAKGFDAMVLREGVRAVDLSPGDGERALRDVEAAGGSVR